MSVLRANKESLMAVLEAFVYDPLINWRLMQADVDSRRPEGVPYVIIIIIIQLAHVNNRWRNRSCSCC
jgi:phosphatidylinositol kinase/protein kinase (PI-3  family)